MVQTMNGYMGDSSMMESGGNAGSSRYAAPIDHTHPAVTIPKAENQEASTASDVAGLKNDLNSLLEKLKDAGLMEEDSPTPG